MTRFLAVALLGAPNAGKSTLLNRLVASRLAIVSPKAQTTRFALRGIKTTGDTQILYVDTPGIFSPKERFGKAMLQSAWQGAAEADHLLLLVDVGDRNAVETTRQLLSRWQAGDVPTTLVLNKVDKIPKEKLLPLVAELAALRPMAGVFMVSALKNDGVDDLEKHLLSLAKESVWFYPPDQLTDINERLYAAEITREVLFHRLKQEVPYGLTVETEKWEEGKNSVKIWQQIVVERETHKPILLGAGGSTIKMIGENARKRIEAQLGRKTHLFLHVKVKPDWKEAPEHYSSLGLEY